MIEWLIEYVFFVCKTVAVALFAYFMVYMLCRAASAAVLLSYREHQIALFKTLKGIK